MPSSHPPQHARSVTNRILRGVQIPASVYRSLAALADTMEAGKSRLKGQLSDRHAQIAKLDREIKQLRDLQSDDNLIVLYNAGTSLLTRQADDIKKQAIEIKKLKGELQRSRDGGERSNRTFALKLAQKDRQISRVEGEKKDCREALRKFEVRLKSLKFGTPDVQADSTLDLAKLKQHLEDSTQDLAKLKQRLEDYRMMADEQQKHIKQLTQENNYLVMALGRQHFDELDLP